MVATYQHSTNCIKINLIQLVEFNNKRKEYKMNFYLHIFYDEKNPPKCICNKTDPESRIYYINAITHYGIWGKNLFWKLEKYNFIMSL